MLTYFISGGAGFVGSHLCRYLLGKGHEVVCLDNFFTGKSRNILDLKKNPKFLPYISNSLAYVSEALERQKQFEPLTQLLSKYLKEFERKT